MFNSDIIDVAIGMIFVYLLLSLMCSAANEIIELLLKKRAIDLERGIRELLKPGSKSGEQDIVQKLYDHALINNLFGGHYAVSKIKSRIPWLRWKRTQLPSYIPARSFALALMDLVALPQEPETSSPPASPPASPPTSPPPSTGWSRLVAFAQWLRHLFGGGSAAPTPEPLPSNPISGASFATAPSLAAAMAAQFASVAAAGGELTSPPLGSPPGALPVDDPFKKLRDAIERNTLLHPTSKRALITLLDAAGGDVAKARENIEKWYDSSMDRVSGWYKRRAQLTILVIGLVVAIGVNVDTITVAKMLSTDKALRASLVNAADAYAKANAEAETTAATSPSETAAAPTGNASPSETAAAPTGNASPSETAAAPGGNAAPAGTAPPAGDASASDTAAPAEAAPTPLPACKEDANSAECLRAKAVQEACKEPKSKQCKSAKSLEEACQDPDSEQCQRAKDVQQACTDPLSPACQRARVLEEACKDSDSTECQNAKALEEPCTDPDPAKCKEQRLEKAKALSSEAGEREEALQEACATENSPACTSAKRVYVACAGSDTVKCQRETALDEACAASANSAECKTAKKLYQACEDPDSPQCQLARACTDPNSVECQRAKALDKACTKDPNSPNCKYLSNEQQLRSLGLPIGWDSPDDPKRKWPGTNFFQTAGWARQFYWHGPGWLLTALAISLGAPFWFDLLNKFIVIRAAVKPHEKSPEEKSKD